MRDLSIILADIGNTNPVENLSEILGKNLGRKLYELMEVAAIADKELDLVHNCLTELYNIDAAVPVIKECLNKIKALK